MAFGVVQYGTEGTATPGTPATPTEVLKNFEAAEWGTDLNIEQPELLTQSYALHESGVILGRTGRLTLRNGILDFEQLPVFLDASLKASAPAGGTAGYLYDWDPSMTADEAFSTHTWRAQFDTVEASMAYGFVQNFEIACPGPRARSTLNVEITGWAWDMAGTVFAGITSPDPVPVAGGAWNVWLDSTGGTVGTTPYAGCLKSFTFRSGDLRGMQECIDGTDQFSDVVKTRYQPEVTMRLVLDSTVEGLLTDYENGTRKLVRLRATGADIGAGTAKSITIDMAGRITAFSRIGSATDQEQWVVDMTLSGEYDSTWAKILQIQIVNAEAATRGAA